MKNNKGFTLIELLVVIVILVSISLVAIPNISKSLSKRKTKELEKEIESLTEYAEIYISKDINIYNCLKNENGYIFLKNIAKINNIKLSDEKNNYGAIHYDSTEDNLKWIELDEVTASTGKMKNCL